MKADPEFVDTECTPLVERTKNTIQHDQKSPYPSTLVCKGKRYFLPIYIAIREVKRCLFLWCGSRGIHRLMHDRFFLHLALFMVSVSDHARTNLSKKLDHALIRPVELEFISDCDVMDICPIYDIDCLEILENARKLFVSVQCRSRDI